MQLKGKGIPWLNGGNTLGCQVGTKYLCYDLCGARPVYPHRGPGWKGVREGQKSPFLEHDLGEGILFQLDSRELLVLSSETGTLAQAPFPLSS